MAIWRFEDRVPKIGEGTFIAPTADVIGDVTIGKNCYVGPGAIIRGDYGTIIIGDETSIQENVVIHARPNDVTKIGSRVTLGHGCIVHNCVIEDEVVVGMRAVVTDYCTVKKWAVIGEGAVVPNSKIVEEGDIVVGVPAKPVGNIHDETKKEIKQKLAWYKDKYVEMARRYLADNAFEKIS